VGVRTRLAAACGLVGVVVLVVGTFLPWVHSGRADHNSYAADGTIQRLLNVQGAARSALSAWPFVGVGCALVVALFALGLTRSAATVGSILALCSAAVAIATLSVDRTALAAPAVLGPAVTLFGATLALLAASLILLSRHKVGGPRRSTP
jgi:hypothetical protein